MDRMNRPRASRPLTVVFALLIACAGVPVAFAGTASAACSSLGPLDHWIGGYTYNTGTSSFFSEGDLASDGAGHVTGQMTSLNGGPVSPNTITGTLTCSGTAIGTVTGVTTTPIIFSAVVAANNNEIVGGTWSSGTLGGTFSSARVLRVVQATNATDLTTDPDSLGATPAQPLQVGVTSPTAGDLSVQLGTSANPALAGYQLLSQVVHIQAPNATPEAPLTFQFVLDSSALLGAPAGEVQVFRNGALLANCSPTAGIAAIPNPCVASRVTRAGGDVQVTVRTAAASIWSFGVNASRGGLRIWTAAIPTARLGQKYYVPLTGLGGTAPYKWKKLTKLPKGLKMKSKTGVISGTPKQSGTFLLPIQIKDKTKQIVARTFTLTIH